MSDKKRKKIESEMLSGCLKITNDIQALNAKGFISKEIMEEAFSKIKVYANLKYQLGVMDGQKTLKEDFKKLLDW